MQIRQLTTSKVVKRPKISEVQHTKEVQAWTVPLLKRDLGQ